MHKLCRKTSDCDAHNISLYVANDNLYKHNISVTVNNHAAGQCYLIK